jgi:hypothetical protein
VVALKNSVPRSWTPELHQSIRRGSKVSILSRRPAAWPGPRLALIVSSHCRAAAEVNSSDPTKKTAPSATGPTSRRNAGIGATRKQVEPMANSTAIHHDARCGAQWTSSRRRARDRREACLRWLREDHSTVLPSDCR